LSNQKFKDFVEQYGEDKIGLITGDIVINPGGQILIMTTEVYRNMAIIKDPLLNDVSYCIMDEIHFISDEERGYIWEESIIFSPEHIRFLFLSATIPNSEEFAGWVSSIKEHKVDVIRHDIRPVPLERRFFDAYLGITTLEKIKEAKELDRFPDYKMFRKGKYMPHRVPRPDFRDLIFELKKAGKLPAIYFVFSRAKTQDYAVSLAKKGYFLTREEQAKMMQIASAEFRKVSPEVLSLNSTRELKQCIPKGVAFHNAGMLPDVKHIVEKLFSAGLIKVLFATETFAVGINMPAKTVCFDNLRKYTKAGFRYLNSKEYIQISGRAGRRGIDKSGLSVAAIHRSSEEIAKIKEFTDKDTLPLKSQFKLTYNTALNLVNLHTDEEIKQILQMNFYTYQQLRGKEGDRRVLASIKARFTKILKTLTKLGYIKDRKLTRLGVFASKIFSFELEISQIFEGEFKYDLDEYTVLLLLAALVYEPKRDTKFIKLFTSKKTNQLIKAVRSHNFLCRGKWIENIDKMTAIVDPCYRQKKFIEIMKNTNLLEGDMIRLFMQILDKLEQIDRATFDDPDRTTMVKNCKHLIKDSLEGIHVF
ncbi:MAG: hypothetical protein KJ574_02935, partial [Nanoarchaeota archaeon]|nr:hypothetical protein [Nanoarchaeota archaeon]